MTQNTKHRTRHYEPWIARNWRPTAAIVYLFICVVDFVIMPVYCQWISTTVSPERIFQLAATLSGPVAQVEALHVMREFHPWQPVTLGGSGLFHVSFGAILGVAAWTRGSEKLAQIAQQTQLGVIQTTNQTIPPPLFPQPEAPKV